MFSCLRIALLAIFLTVGVSGCATYQRFVSDISLVSAAETTEQRAYALYATYVVAQEQALVIVKNRNIPASVRRSIQSAEASVKPAMDLVRLSARKLINARNQFSEAGNDSSEGLNVKLVTQELTDYLSKATPLVERLTRLVAQNYK